MKIDKTFVATLFLAGTAAFLPDLLFADNTTAAIAASSPGDTAFVLIASAMVLLMTPGLGLFYGGMVRKKNVLSTLMQSYLMLGLITCIWVIYGFSLAFSPSGASGNLIGDFSFLCLNGVSLLPDPRYAASIPQMAYMAFQMKFAIITVALISGALAERVRFRSFILFAVLWCTFVYCPVCRWVWGPGGFIRNWGALDFAGGTVVHIISGVSALTACILLGKRRGLGEESMLPHNMTYVLLGTGLLWFGWFGFNAGSALAANGVATLAFVNTNIAAAAAMLSWLAGEWVHNGKPTALGAASGAVAGLVAITPAAGFVSPAAAIVLGLVVSPVCYWAVFLKGRLGYDDALDAFGVHGVGGTFGALATGLFASKAINPSGADGWFYGNPGLLWVQAKAVLVVAAYACAGTVLIFKAVDSLFGMRVSPRDEELGLDLTQHSEAGYEI
jgi:Amt family ammonium transporter